MQREPLTPEPIVRTLTPAQEERIRKWRVWEMKNRKGIGFAEQYVADTGVLLDEIDRLRELLRKENP